MSIFGHVGAPLDRLFNNKVPGLSWLGITYITLSIPLSLSLILLLSRPRSFTALVHFSR